MPWATPTLREVREMVRDDVTAALGGAVVIGNSVLRVMSDAKAGLAHLVLRYIDWLSRQLLPDTAETEWLDRHGNIWLTNADGSVGRKVATYASGSVKFTGIDGSIVPQGTQLEGIDVNYETTEEVTIGPGAVEAAVVALSSGVIGNRESGETLSVIGVVSGVDTSVEIVSLIGGTDEESDEELRARILFRIQRPPMGGDKDDYELWTRAVAGVTRAWAAPNEMGIGTVTIRFLMEDLYPENYGVPMQEDIDTVGAYIDTKRPVAVKDIFVVAPIIQPIDLTIASLSDDTTAVRARIEASLLEMFEQRSAPGQTIYRSWVDEAISSAIGEEHHELTFVTTPATSNGHMPVLGNITYS